MVIERQLRKTRQSRGHSKLGEQKLDGKNSHSLGNRFGVSRRRVTVGDRIVSSTSRRLWEGESLVKACLRPLS